MKMFFMGSIRNKMVLFITLILLVVCIGLSTTSYYIASGSLKDNVDESLVNIAEEASKVVESRINEQLSSLEAVAFQNSLIKDKNIPLETKVKSLNQEKDRMGYIMMAITDKSGKSLSTNGKASNISDREYFKKAIAGTRAISDPIVSKEDKSVVIAYAVPIKSEGEVIGTIVALRDGNELSSITNGITFGNSGKAFMLNQKGTTIAHSNRDLVINMDNDFENVKQDPMLEPLVKLEKQMVEGKTGSGEYSYNGTVKYLGFSPIKSTGWSIAVAAPKSEVFAGLNKLKTIVVVLSLIILLLSAALVFFIANRISNPIKIAVAHLKEIAKGDLSKNVPSKFLSYRDEVGQLAHSVNEILDSQKSQADNAKRIANGQLDIEVTVRSEHDILAKSMKQVVETLRNLVEETNKLTKAAVEGRLNTRGDGDKFNGGYKEIINGLNNTLNAVIEPVKEAADVLKEVAEGNLNVKVKGDYKGDHAEIKEALNSTIESLLRYINDISGVLNRMSEGNLDTEISGDYKGDFIEIKDAINKIIKSLNKVLGEINEAAEQVATGARQVSDSSQVLSQGSTEQASSIEEITSSMTEVASQTKQNAINANQANELAETAKNAAVQGNVQMREMLKSMEGINEASSNISKIIKVIDEIAFQTNILALNAAVEAARAGQYGKGFAVVAEEVRNLAARSANAAKETTMLIEGSVKKVEVGTKIANDTAGALESIVSSVTRAAEIVGDIANASNEQATGIAQVNVAISQVSQVTQTNSATAEESAAASEELSSQAEVLKEMVNRFRLKKNDISMKSMDGLDPDILKMVEKITKKKQEGYDKRRGTGESHSASRVKINLNDMDFGKY
ncbi:MAG: methyl-accepting chemotaxis protein [Clostridia bacterium]|nr:methyl-accepting chemotaxis protein [Clostridia bacterium]